MYPHGYPNSQAMKLRTKPTPTFQRKPLFKQRNCDFLSLIS
jgi:hypothetical protein